jgi:hypothetical protein
MHPIPPSDHLLTTTPPNIPLPPSSHPIPAADTLRSGAGLGELLAARMLPSSELRSFRGAPIARNAFALDFLKHAQVYG